MRAALALLTTFFLTGAFGATLHIGVAANFKDTSKIIAQRFQTGTGHKISQSSASTGTLYNQIVQGAPFDIFFAADDIAAKKLESAGLVSPGLRFCYGLGQLVLVGANAKLEDLGERNLSLAIANPLTAPYGRAALEILERAEFDSAADRKLVRASNVAQAFQYWHSGAVDLAIVAKSLAGNTGIDIPANWYAPIRQEAVVLKHAKDSPEVKDYLNYFRSESIQSLLSESGYGKCP